MGGGLITDICGTACALYRRSTAYVRLPTTLIGMIDAAIAIKVGGNLAEKHKNRIGAFHPHSGDHRFQLVVDAIRGARAERSRGAHQDLDGGARRGFRAPREAH